MNPVKYISNTTLRTCALAALAALTLGLSACGGGDSGPSGPSNTSTLFQGRWSSTGAESTYTAIVVPATSGANTPAVDTIWALAQDASTLYKLQATGAAQTPGTVTGQRYTLGGSAMANVTPGTYSAPVNTATPQFILDVALGSAVTFSRSDSMIAPLQADQANGRWQASLGPIQVNWTVQNAGVTNNVSGTSTTGCTYSGQSTVVASQSLYLIELSENCASVVQTFNGVATLTGDNSRLTVVAANADNSRGVALLFSRQP